MPPDPNQEVRVLPPEVEPIHIDRETRRVHFGPHPGEQVVAVSDLSYIEDKVLGEAVDLLAALRRAHVSAGEDKVANAIAMASDAVLALREKGSRESLPERVERLEAELVDAEAAVERKRQEDGP